MDGPTRLAPHPGWCNVSVQLVIRCVLELSSRCLHHGSWNNSASSPTPPSRSIHCVVTCGRPTRSTALPRSQRSLLQPSRCDHLVLATLFRRWVSHGCHHQHGPADATLPLLLIMEMIFVASTLLSRNGVGYHIDVWRSMRNCQQSRELGGDPSHVVLQLTPNWAWQRFLEWFETVVAARQLDRSSHQSRC